MLKLTCRKSLMLLFLIFPAAAAYAHEVQCPPYHGKRPLLFVDLFDGPPENLSELRADISRGSGEQAYASLDVGYIFDQRRNLYIECKYGDWGDTRETVTIKVEKKVRRCIYRAHPRGQPVELKCK